MTTKHLAVATLVFGFGCVKKDYEQCSSGLLCPSPKVCAEPSGLCVSQNQVTECENRVDGAGCSLGAPQTSLNALWAFGRSNVYAVGDAGVILHFDGSTWSIADVGTSTQMNAIWGPRPNDIFIVGDEATAFHYDGTAWKQIATDALGSLESVFGAGDSVWAVGDFYVGRYDGTKFVKVDVGVDVNGTDVWAAADSVFVTTDHGSVMHFDGATWQADQTTGLDLAGIWGASERDVFAVGVLGTIQHYDGTAWTEMSSGTMRELEEVHGSDGSNVFATGTMGTLLHFNGTDWQAIDTGEDALINSIAIIGTEGFAVGEGGLILEGNGTTWHRAATEGKCTYKVCLPAESTP